MGVPVVCGLVSAAHVAEGECKREEVVEITVGGEDLDMVVEAFAGGTGGLE